MKVTYCNGFEDLTLSYSGVIKRSPLYKKQFVTGLVMRWVFLQCVISSIILLLNIREIEGLLVSFYFWCNVVFLVLYPSLHKRKIKNILKLEAQRKNWLQNKSIDIKESELVIEMKNARYFIGWEEILEIHKLNESIWIGGRDLTFIIPSNAFESVEEFDKYFVLATQYRNNCNKTIGESRCHQNKKNGLNIKPAVLGFLCVLLLVITHFLFSVSGINNAFWTEVFSDGEPRDLYSQFPENIKDSIPLEEWTGLVNKWRQTIGLHEKTRKLSSVPCDLRIKKADGTLMDKYRNMQKEEYEITGQNGEIILTLYYYHFNDEWQLYGFEALSKTATIDSYVDFGSH